MEKININRVPSFYHRYIEQVSSHNVIDALEEASGSLLPLLKHVEEEKWEYSYAEGKWSIKELVQHLIDSERIFNYRALCLARGEQNPLPGFDENTYAANSKAFKRTKADLLDEFSTVQQATLKLFQSFDKEQLDASGSVNGKPNYVEAIGFIIAGHNLHHKNILEDRYLQIKKPA